MISLPVLAVMVVTGVSLVVALVHFSGGSKTAELRAGDTLARHFADLGGMGEIDWFVIDETRTMALATDHDGQLGLAAVTGKHVTVHAISEGEVVACQYDAGTKHVAFKLDGLAWPKRTMVFGSEADAETAARELTARMSRKRQEV